MLAPDTSGRSGGTAMKYTVEFPLEAVSAADDVELIGRAVDRLGYDALAITEHPAPSKAWLEDRRERARRA